MSRLRLIDPARDLTPKIVADLLSLVCVDAGSPADWSPVELRIAYDWAIREHLHASDNVVRRRPRPWFLDARKDGDSCAT